MSQNNSTEHDDLQELRKLTKDNDNTDVGERIQDAYDTPDAVENYDYYDDYPNDEGTLKENARLWAKVGDAYFPSDEKP